VFQQKLLELDLEREKHILKILLFSAMYPPIRTGTSFYSKNLADSLINLGHEVKIVTLKNKEVVHTENNQWILRLNAFHFNLKKYFKHFRISSLFPANYTRVARLVENFRPDSIILVNHYLDIAFLAIFASKRCKKPLYVSVGTQLQSLSPVRNIILNKLDRLICGNMVFPHAHKIIAWDQEILRYLNEVHRNRFEGKQVVIPFGVNGDPGLYESKRHNYELKNQLLGVGGVIDHRNYVFQVKVFNELIKVYPKLQFKIIGHVYDNRAQMLVKELGIEERVVFMGEQPHEVVLEEMNNSDLHWMMLDGEYTGLGTANMEAMLLGVPVVSNIPKNLFGPDSLVEMKNFIQADSKSIGNTLLKIVDVLKDKDKRESIGLNGKRFVVEKMNWHHVAAEIERLCCR